MVDVYAPWCTHCRQMEPLWNAFSEDSTDLNIKVGKVDGTQEHALLSRFHVKGFPSLFLLRNGSAWAYNGGRSIREFREFALKGYSSIDPVPFYKSPVGLVGRMLGKVYGLPTIGRRAYRILRNDMGYSDMSIVLSLLALPVVVGIVMICMLDGFFLRSAMKADPPPHTHQD
ncbi:MAG: hypothetical protein WDW36_006436 [Sanguina aurantia]